MIDPIGHGVAPDKQPDGRLVIPLEIGSKVEPWGQICAVAFLSGERYYFMRGKRGTISMMPWGVVENQRRNLNG